MSTIFVLCYTQQHMHLTRCRKLYTRRTPKYYTTALDLQKCTLCTPFWKIKCIHIYCIHFSLTHLNYFICGLKGRKILIKLLLYSYTISGNIILRGNLYKGNMWKLSAIVLIYQTDSIKLWDAKVSNFGIINNMETWHFVNNSNARILWCLHLIDLFINLRQIKCCPVPNQQLMFNDY